MRTILLRLSFSNGWLLYVVGRLHCGRVLDGPIYCKDGEGKNEDSNEIEHSERVHIALARPAAQDTIRDAIDGRMDRRGSSTAPAATRPTRNTCTFWIAVRHACHISIRLLPGVGGEHCWGDSSICTCNFVQLFYSAQLMLLAGKRQAGAFFATSDERTACESLFYIIFLKPQPSHTPCSSSPCVYCRVASAVICAHI